jgi:hypothetical protein
MNTKTKNVYIVIAAAVAVISSVFGTTFLLSGCETTDARRAGRGTTGLALIAFDDPADEEVFRVAKEKIDAYLLTGQPITDAVIDLFVNWLAAELERNPAAVRLVVSELKEWVLEGQNLDPGEIEPARAFVEGVSDALGIAFPDR